MPQQFQLTKKHSSVSLYGCSSWREDIKCSKYATFGTKNLSRNIIKALKNRTACLIANHGQVAFGENLEKTFELAQEIENICHQYINAIRIEYLRFFQKRNENSLRKI